jgi:plasmid stability protein
MITRLDDDLHARLKARAATEGRSVNDLVIEALNQVLEAATTRQAVRERARTSGRLVVPEPPGAPARGKMRDALPEGFGGAVRAALDAERSAR